MKRRAYRATDVKNVLVEEVLKTAPTGAATAGLDIGKYELRAVVRWKDGSFERPWKVENPAEIARMVELLRMVAEGRPLIVAMESTGTYGDAVRARLDQAGLEVHRVGGKAAARLGVGDPVEGPDALRRAGEAGGRSDRVGPACALGPSRPGDGEDREVPCLGGRDGRCSPGGKRRPADAAVRRDGLGCVSRDPEGAAGVGPTGGGKRGDSAENTKAN